MEETSTKKGVFYSVLGIAALATASFCVANVVKDLNALDALETVENAKNIGVSMMSSGIYAVLNALAGVFCVGKGVYNILDNQK